MKVGSENEEPTLTKLRTEHFIDCIYEVGLLQSYVNWSLGVSPDGVCILSTDDNLNGQAACIEIKTRVKPTTIAKAEAARAECGRVVWCYFGDVTFNKCVPAENRHQVLHQAAVTKLAVGVFVTAKVEEDQGSIVQIVIVRIQPVQHVAHIHKLLPVAEALIGWVYNDDNMIRGRLCAEDMPLWMMMEQKDVLQTRVKLVRSLQVNFEGQVQLHANPSVATLQVSCADTL